MSDEDAELENFLCRVGMVFLPNDDKLAAEARDIIEHVVAKEGRCKVKAWRDVPVDKSVVGRLAKATEPRIVQVCPLHSESLAIACVPVLVKSANCTFDRLPAVYRAAFRQLDVCSLQPKYWLLHSIRKLTCQPRIGTAISFLRAATKT